MKRQGWLIGLIIMTGITVFAASESNDPERIDRTYKVFSSSLDKLLLETPHVYIRSDHKTMCFFLPHFGAVFTANVSITQSASLPEIVNMWSQWFNNEDGPIIINTKKKQKETPVPDAGEPGSEPTPCIESDKMKDIQKDDQKRVEVMQTSVTAFKMEVMEVILDFSSILQGLDSNDRLALIFHVADEAFFDLYHTRSLQVQIPIDTLRDLGSKRVDDQEVIKAFQWNI
ncbi:hypothetical protein JXA80_10255 [bacterium]|nr:hypothetical protein [candidate division CSSED10-310 bacterium]